MSLRDLSIVVDAETDNAIDSVETLDASVDSVSSQFTKMDSRIKLMERSLNKSSVAMDEFGDKSDIVDGFNNNLNRTVDTFKNVGNASESISGDIQRSWLAVTNTITNIGKNISGTAKDLKDVAIDVTKIVIEFKLFYSTYSMIRKVKNEFDSLKTAIVATGASYGMTEENFRKFLSVGSKAKYIEALPASMKLASKAAFWVALGIESEEAIRKTTGVVNYLNGKIDDSTEKSKKFHDKWKDTSHLLQMSGKDWTNNWDHFKDTFSDIMDSVFSLSIITDTLTSIFTGVWLILDDIMGFAGGEKSSLTEEFLMWLGLSPETIEKIRKFASDVIATMSMIKERFTALWDYLVVWWETSAFADWIKTGFISIFKGIVWVIVGAIGILSALIAGLIAIFAIAIHEVMQFFEYIAKIWNETGSLTEFMSIIWQDFKVLVMDILQKIGDLFNEYIIDPFMEWAGPVIDYVKEQFESFFEFIDEMFASIVEVYEKVTNSIASFFGKKHSTKIEVNRVENISRNISTDNQVFAFPNPLRGFASGGIMPSNQFAMVGEDGPELVFPKNEMQVIPTGQTKEILANNQNGQTVTKNYSFGNIIVQGNNSQEVASNLYQTIMDLINQNENSQRVELGMSPNYG